MKRLIGAALALLLAASLSAPPANAYEPHVLRYADTLDINTLNPWIATSGNIITLSELTAAYFTRLDAKGNPVPELVTVIPTQKNGGISRDGKTITWHLRHGVKWSDGVPFDAGDVTYTWRVAQDRSNNIAVRDVWDRVSSITAPDKYTVVFRMKEPYATFAVDYFCTASNSSVLPEHVLGPGTNFNQSPYNALPVGIGPFRYTAFRRGASVEMEANPNYWRGLPKLHKIIYKMIADDNTDMTQLRTGELDLWDTVNGTMAAGAMKLPGKAWSTRLSNYMSAIFFNTSKPQLKDPAVRRALRLATNRPLIFDKVVLRNGALTESVVPRMTHGYLDLPVTKYDPQAAETMLDAAGWKRGPNGVRRKNGMPLTLDIVIPSGYGPSETLSALLQSDYTKIGVAATIHAYASGTFFGPYAAGGIVQTGKFDAALHSESLGPVYANVNGVLTCSSIPPNGFNETRYCNKTVDKLNDVYLHSYDRAVQDKAAAQFQRIIDRDAPLIMIYERAFLAVYDKRLTGYHPNSFSSWGGNPMQIDI
ncbi:MAG TPA: peptide ABC transporter substrate-binding protein [Candidatus Lustribacter sp.]